MIDIALQPLRQQQVPGPMLLDPALSRSRDRFEPADATELSDLARAFSGKGGGAGGAAALFEFQYQSVHAVSLSRDGSGVSRREFFAESLQIRLTVAGTPEGVQSLLDRLRSEFTPEKVAGRIADFATAGYKGPGEKGAREAFRAYIQKAVESGYAAALSLLGPLGAGVKEPLEKTMDLLRDRLDAFSQGEDYQGVETDSN